MFEVIGRCVLDVDSILKGMPSLIKEENTCPDGRPFWKHVYSVYKGCQKDEDFKILNDAYERSFPKRPFIPKDSDEHVEAFMTYFKVFIDDISTFDMKLKCYYIDDMIAVVGPNFSREVTWVFPSKYVTLQEYKNYDVLTGTERRALLSSESTEGSNTSIMFSKDTSRSDLVSKRNEAQSKIETLSVDIQDIKEAKTEELRSLQEEIDKKTAELEEKKNNMISILNAKKLEMETKLEKMNMELFELESEIYAIRCYTGEVLELKKIRSGKSSSEDTPFIFFQKMKYLDEELGKLASIYDVDYTDADTFESILKHRDDIMESFVPSERSLVLFKVSHSNKTFCHVEGQNMLNWYEKYHGRKVAIILRDGDNLYLAWTDDEKINFSDDAFLRPGVTEDSESSMSQKEFETDSAYEKRIKNLKMNNIKEGLGRYFIFSLLQGIVDRGVIKFPEKVNVMNSPYIVFSYAEGWISTNEYGSLSDMIDKCNRYTKGGDPVLLTDSIRAERRSGYYGGYVDQTYHNDRGRGEKNRTHDVHASDNTIYRINMVEHTAKYSYVVKYRTTGESHTDESYWTDQEFKEFKNRNWELGDWYYSDLKKIENSDSYQYFISLAKRENWSTGKCARANFEIFKDEFINLTFMNSVWIEYVLTNHKLGTIKIHGNSIDFAYIIPYLKSALQYVKNRESQFSKHMMKYNPELLKDDKWPVKLSEWMLENDIHNFSEFRAKQFSKYYQESL